MAWLDWIEQCRTCNQPFSIRGGGRGPTTELEAVACPHCGVEWGKRRTAGTLRTQPLEPEQEALWRQRMSTTCPKCEATYPQRLETLDDPTRIDLRCNRCGQAWSMTRHPLFPDDPNGGGPAGQDSASGSGHETRITA